MPIAHQQRGRFGPASVEYFGAARVKRSSRDGTLRVIQIERQPDVGILRRVHRVQILAFNSPAEDEGASAGGSLGTS